MESKEEKNKKKFDTVQTFRKNKEKISKDLRGKSFEEIKKYLKTRSAKLPSE